MALLFSSISVKVAIIRLNKPMYLTDGGLAHTDHHDPATAMSDLRCMRYINDVNRNVTRVGNTPFIYCRKRYLLYCILFTFFFSLGMVSFMSMVAYMYCGIACIEVLVY